MTLAGAALRMTRTQTVNDVLLQAAQSESGLTFVDLREQERFLSFKELHQRARRVAASLYGMGIRREDRVGIILPTGEPFMDAFFGVLLCGAVPVPLYPPLRLGRLDEYHVATALMLRKVDARLVITDTRIKRILGQTIAGAMPELGCELASDLLATEDTLELSVDGGALGLIQFSSGSTVDPKPVALTQRSLVAQLGSLRAAFPQAERHLGVSWLPLYHDMGLIGCLLSAIYYPGPLVLIPPENFLAKPALWLRAISRHRATLSPAPNFAYGLCLKRVKDEELVGVDLSCWKAALNGAEPVSVPTLRRFAERFSRYGLSPSALMPVYGMSEAALAVTFSSPERGCESLKVDPEALAREGAALDGTREVPSVGRPVPGVAVQVRDELGREQPDRRVGRIFVRSVSLMAGYFGDPVATDQALAGDWLDTGDLGFTLEGQLFICGRAKDLVIVRGANHVPQEFEECLEGLEGVRQGCAVALGFNPEGAGEELLVLAERATGESVPERELVEQIRAAILARTGVRPHTVKLLAPGTLPRTSSGKLRRGEALRRYLAGELKPPASVGGMKLAAEVVRSKLAFARLRTR